VDGKFLGFNVNTTIESHEIFSYSRKENDEIEAIIPTKFGYPDEDRDNMFEEEIHKLLANDVTCNLLEVDGSISPNEDPNKLKTVLPEVGRFFGVTELKVMLK
jgi:hypothetical protein